MTRAKRRQRLRMAKDRAAVQGANPNDWSVTASQEARDAEKLNPGPEWPVSKEIR
jgi:hypothetical protein